MRPSCTQFAKKSHWGPLSRYVPGVFGRVAPVYGHGCGLRRPLDTLTGQPGARGGAAPAGACPGTSKKLVAANPPRCESAMRASAPVTPAKEPGAGHPGALSSACPGLAVRLAPARTPPGASKRRKSFIGYVLMHDPPKHTETSIKKLGARTKLLMNRACRPLVFLDPLA